jgi:hypothetical protein
MKIILDCRVCKCWDAACDTHFGWHFLRDEITPVDCVVDMVEDGNEELTFYIQDRDGSEKILLIDEDNKADAYDSWRQAWERQQHASG